MPLVPCVCLLGLMPVKRLRCAIRPRCNIIKLPRQGNKELASALGWNFPMLQGLQAQAMLTASKYRGAS